MCSHADSDCTSVDTRFIVGGGTQQAGSHETFVQVENLQKPMCGKSRPHFFRGVATVSMVSNYCLHGAGLLCPAIQLTAAAFSHAFMPRVVMVSSHVHLL
jgi:hypothetical protein